MLDTVAAMPGGSLEKDVFEKREADHHVSLTGNRNEKIDGTLSLVIGEDVHAKVKTNLEYDVGTEISLKSGTTLVLEIEALTQR